MWSTMPIDEKWHFRQNCALNTGVISTGEGARDVPFWEENWGHNSVSLFEKQNPLFRVTDKNVQLHKLKRRIVVHEDARFILLFRVYRYDEPKFLLVSKFIPIITCTFPLRWNCIPIIPYFSKEKVPLKNGTSMLPYIPPPRGAKCPTTLRWNPYVAECLIYLLNKFKSFILTFFYPFCSCVLKIILWRHC